MESDRRLSLIVGAFFLVALLGFAVIVLSLSTRSGVIRTMIRLMSNDGD